VAPEEKDEKQSNVDKLVQLFGSQRQKRALSAAHKNRVDSHTLAGAIAPAFTHAQEKLEEAHTQGPLGVMRRHSR